MSTGRKGRKVAWAITGSGDKIAETIGAMNNIKHRYGDRLDIWVYLSKAGELILKWYGLEDELRRNFKRVMVETGANQPFLAGDLQLGRFEFLLIAPASSNTVAKLAVGIADTLVTNSAIMAMKGSVPVYVMPSDYKEGVTMTKLPDGKSFRLRVRKEDAENAEKLARMKGVTVIGEPRRIIGVFAKNFES
jgi:archaeoflavoprotein AfpA